MGKQLMPVCLLFVDRKTFKNQFATPNIQILTWKWRPFSHKDMCMSNPSYNLCNKKGGGVTLLPIATAPQLKNLNFWRHIYKKINQCSNWKNAGEEIYQPHLHVQTNYAATVLTEEKQEYVMHRENVTHNKIIQCEFLISEKCWTPDLNQNVNTLGLYDQQTFFLKRGLLRCFKICFQ